MSRNLQLIVFFLIASAMSAAGLIARLTWNNLDLIILDTLLRPFLAIVLLSVGAGCIAFFISKRLFVLVPLIVFAIFSYGTLSEYFVTGVAGKWIAAAILTSALANAIYLTRNVQPLQIAQGAAMLFTVMAVPFTMPVFGLLLQPNPPQLAPAFANYVSELAPPSERQVQLPDVIYIVPDRYGSSHTLKKIYGLDNSNFYRQLRKRGFVLNADAVSNYPTTAHSLSSTMNSGYLDRFVQLYGADTGRLQPLYTSIENNYAQQAMRQLGYNFINAGSWWDPSKHNRNAVRNFGASLFDGITEVSLTEIEHLLWRGTPLREVPGLSLVKTSEMQCRRIKRKLDWLETVGNEQKPVFVFAHMIIPHSPVVADKNGRCLPQSIDFPKPGVNWPQFKSAYADYLRYFNHAMLTVFDQQLQRRVKSGRPLLFIIQSDEGPYPQVTRLQKKKQNFIDLPETQLRNKIGILNAMYFTGDEFVDASELKTPVNNWRIILEYLTGKPASRQEHKVRIYKDYQRVYDFVDLTDRFITQDEPRSIQRPVGWPPSVMRPSIDELNPSAIE